MIVGDCFLITDKQKKMIKVIECKTNKTFNGSSFEEALDFISRYIDDLHKPTEKQIRTAKYICKKYNVKCKARTKSEFYKFIEQYLGEDFIR